MRIHHVLLSFASSVLVPLGTLLLATPAGAQDPPAEAAATKADHETAIVRSLAGDDVLAASTAVSALVQADAAGRQSLKTLLERVAPARAALPPASELPAGSGAREPLTAETKALVADLLHDDDATAEAAATKLTAAVETAPQEVRKVVARTDALLGNYILRVFRRHSESTAIFAGQYAALNELGPAAREMISTWIVKPPPGGNPAELRAQSIRAVRDLVEGEAGDELAAKLRKVATDGVTAGDVRREAVYALAQFGDRSLIDPQIEAAQKQVESGSDAAKATALAELANIHYQLRDYDQAVAAYAQHLALIEAGTITDVRNLPTLYYNACCSLALAGKTDAAFAHLEKAIEAGKKSGPPLPRRLLEVDMDIASLRGDPRFADVLAKIDGKK
jgi:tetratricopeptide (TPR) repeat protein